MAERNNEYSILISPVIRRYIDEYPETKKYILKLGGSIITDKDSDKPLLRKDRVKKIAKEIKSFYNPEKNRLLIVHGAGSFGHPIVNMSGIGDGMKRKDQLLYFAKTQKQVTFLNAMITDLLIAEEIPAFPYQLSSVILRDGKITNMPTENIEMQLKFGMIPVLYGVPAVDRGTICSILSGDQIGPYVANSLGIKNILEATAVDGVFDRDPEKDTKAKKIDRIDREYFLKLERDLLKGKDIGIGDSSSTDVTGGMFGKLKELFRWTEGAKIQIFDGREPENIGRALSEEVLGTMIYT